MGCFHRLHATIPKKFLTILLLYLSLFLFYHLWFRSYKGKPENDILCPQAMSKWPWPWKYPPLLDWPYQVKKNLVGLSFQFVTLAVIWKNMIFFRKNPGTCPRALTGPKRVQPQIWVHVTSFMQSFFFRISIQSFILYLSLFLFYHPRFRSY